MRNILMALICSLCMFACDSGGSSTYSSGYSQPTTSTVLCSYCSGNGVVFNPYSGNYVHCQHCGGTGTITKSNPAFTGSKYACGNGGCLCRKYEKKSTFNSDCKNCGHAKEDHYGY